MERLSHDLNLALEESDCGRQERRKTQFPPLRRRAHSAGNLPAAVAVSLVEDGSSSSPPQAPLITQPLSDSDDPHLDINKTTHKSRHYCQIGNFESDSFNENFSPTRPANARRKRKFKKVPVEYVDGKQSPPVELLSVTTESNSTPSSVVLQTHGFIPISHTNKHKSGLRPERNSFCGKRKWSQRDKSDICEMRERSFSGGCSSKSTLMGKNDFKTKKYDIDKRKKDVVLQPGKIVLKPQNSEGAKTFTVAPSLPGSSSFNFVYKSAKNGTPMLPRQTGFKVSTSLPPFFNPTTSTGRNSYEGRFYRKLKMLNKTYPQNSLRNPLNFDDSNSGMDCVGNESSSLSSSDSDGVITNDSDREGDDELTDWPGIEELKVFNKSLTFKTSKTLNNNSPNTIGNMPPPKRQKKEKFLVKGGFASCKNKFKKKRPKVDSGNDDDAVMSDSKTVVDLEEEEVITKEIKDILQPHSSFTSFSEVKDAGMTGQNANEQFFQSFQDFQDRATGNNFNEAPRTNFSLQKTSSSDLNISERSPQSDHYCSEHSIEPTMSEVREIRAGCRRIREERPGILILSAANEQLSKFLQDTCQAELTLPVLNDPEEKEKLESLAKLYSLELLIDMGRPMLKKTSNTMRAVQVEHCHHHTPTDHKRRCYGGSLSPHHHRHLVHNLLEHADLPKDLLVADSMEKVLLPASTD